MLFLESEFVEVEEAYLKHNQTTRHTRLDQKLIQAKLFRLWESYDGNRPKNGSYKLLKKSSTSLHQKYDSDWMLIELCVECICV